MKKHLSIWLLFALLLSSLSLCASAAEAFDISDGVLVRYTGSAANVTVPGNVAVIGDEAFAGNQTLKSVVIPETVQAVGERAFYGCSSLSSVTGGASVCEVGALAFQGTPYLEQSTDQYFMLGTVLLWYNGAADSVSLPTACTAIAPYAFLKAADLRSVTAHEGLISVGEGAFYGCSSLTEVHLPATVSFVGAYAFDGTPALDKMGDFPVLGDGVLVKYLGSDTAVTLPDGVRRIASRAFVSSKLSAVTLPDSVYAIDPYAFADCVGLTTLSLNDGLTYIGDGAFQGCKSLTALRTPATLAYIGQRAFSGDIALVQAALQGDSLAVSYHAFQGCSGLRWVLLSEGVSALYDNAFDSCTALEGISIPLATGRVSSSALSGCDKVKVFCNADSAAHDALSAYTVGALHGDVDNDKTLSIMDATAIQRYLARMTALSGAQTASADLDYDGDINIVDAVYVQDILAGLR